MIDKATVVGWLREFAASRLDDVLRPHGFSRSASSLTYARKVPEGRQRIFLDLYVRPSYHREGFHLSLRCSIAFPEMSKAAAAMLGEDSVPKAAVVDIVSLDMIRSNPRMLLFANPGELAALGPAVEGHLVRSVVPYLDERDTIAKITAAKTREIAAYEVPPGDIGIHGVYVAAGELALGQPDRALKTLEAAYPEGTAGHATFGRAFAAVRNVLATRR